MFDYNYNYIFCSIAFFYTQLYGFKYSYPIKMTLLAIIYFQVTNSKNFYKQLYLQVTILNTRKLHSVQWFQVFQALIILFDNNNLFLHSYMVSNMRMVWKVIGLDVLCEL